MMKLRDGKKVGSTQVNDNSDTLEYTDNIEDIDMLCTKKRDTDNNSKRGMETNSNLEGDYLNVLLLFSFYVLQGIPLGLAGSIPMILQNKNISYKQQAMFSFVFWPFSLKLLWAPIVDAAFFQQFGRRKTWLVPVQYLIGTFMLLLSMKVDSMLDSEVPNVLFLTIVFFSLNFLAATQDIAVDGWALTMLQKHNVGYASTCNSVGQTAGYFLGNVVLLAFSSADFCNKYLRSSPQDVGVITLAGFLFFWGVVFLTTTTMVWFFKHEKEDTDVADHGIIGTYLLLLKIVKLPAVQELILILLTVKIGFSATDAVTGLKLVEAGVKKETLALLAVPLVPLQILLPLVISKFTTGPRPLNIFKRAIPFRLFMGLVFAAVVYWTHRVRPVGQEEFPYYYFIVILFIYGLHQIAAYSMFVAIMAFFAKVSDPTIGGTYMTMLNTLCNLGGNWPVTVMLWFVDPLTSKECSGGTTLSGCSNADLSKIMMYTMGVSLASFHNKISVTEYQIGGTYITMLNTFINLGGSWSKSVILYLVDGLTWKECSGVPNMTNCNGPMDAKTCTDSGGKCEITIDGYYIESVVCVALGFLWLLWRRRSLTHLQNLKETAWKVT